jgi:hypothetical protein
VPRNNHPGLMYRNSVLFVCRDLTTKDTLCDIQFHSRKRSIRTVRCLDKNSVERRKATFLLKCIQLQCAIRSQSLFVCIRPRMSQLLLLSPHSSKPPLSSQTHRNLLSQLTPKLNPSKNPTTTSLASTGWGPAFSTNIPTFSVLEGQ